MYSKNKHFDSAHLLLTPSFYASLYFGFLAFTCERRYYYYVFHIKSFFTYLKKNRKENQGWISEYLTIKVKIN
jgi:hypothetical protein